MVILKAADPRKPGSIEVLALKEFIPELLDPGHRGLPRL